MQVTLIKNQISGIGLNNRSKESVLNLYGSSASYDIGDKTIEETLCHPDYVSQVTLVNDYTFFDMKLSFKGDSCVAITRNEDKYDIETDLDFDTLFNGIQVYTGNSILMSSDLDLKLTLKEANLFASIIDTLRSKRRLVGEVIGRFTESELQSFHDNDSSISAYVHRMTGSDDREDLKKLILKDIIKVDGDGYQIIGEALKLLYSFSTIDNYIEVAAAANVTGGFTVLQSGLHTALYLEKTNDGVNIKTMAPAIVLELMSELLLRNEKLLSIAKPLKKSSPVEVAIVRNFCSNCGTKLNDDAKFCAACGSKV